MLNFIFLRESPVIENLDKNIRRSCSTSQLLREIHCKIFSPTKFQNHAQLEFSGNSFVVVEHKRASHAINQINQSVSQTVSQSVSQSVSSQSVCKSVSQSIKQSTNQSINQSINQSVSQSVSQSVTLSVRQSVSQSINQSTNQSIKSLSVAVLIQRYVGAAVRHTEPEADAAAGHVDAEVAPGRSAGWPRGFAKCLNR